MSSGVPAGGGERLARRRRRRAADLWLGRLGAAALVVALGLLGIVLAAIVAVSWPAFTQTTVRVEVLVDPALVPAGDPHRGDFRAVVAEAAASLGDGRGEAGAALRILTPGAAALVRRAVVADPSLVGRTIVLGIPVADPYDQLAKGRVDRAAPEADRRLSDADIVRFDRLVAEGRVSRPLNLGLLVNTDSRFPEMAGLSGALVGSALTLAVCLAVSLPVGVATSILLEEFAPRNRLTALVEASLNNLAAVPPILFGLLGLAVLIVGLGMPRSSPLVAGLVLALMTLPTVVIATRRALQAVPRSVREAGLAIGASRHQVVLHHVLPLALPGILTGAVLALAQALGEVAPLLLIGMNAFITSVPHGVTDAATTLPAQILLWAESPEVGFVSRAAAAILVLLVVLVALNALAVLLRRRSERAS